MYAHKKHMRLMISNTLLCCVLLCHRLYGACVHYCFLQSENTWVISVVVMCTSRFNSV